MGIATTNIVSQFNVEHFICSICTLLFDDPIVVRQCGHMFCRECAGQWMKSQPPKVEAKTEAKAAKTEASCPECRQTFTEDDMTEPARMIKNLLEEVEFNCENDGCEEVIRYSKVKEHKLQCTKRRADCAACGVSMPFLNLEIHQDMCCMYLKQVNAELRSSLKEKEGEIFKHLKRIGNQTGQLQQYQAKASTFKEAETALKSLKLQLEQKNAACKKQTELIKTLQDKIKNLETAHEGVKSNSKPDPKPIAKPADPKMFTTPKNLTEISLTQEPRLHAAIEMIGTDMKDGIYSANGYQGKLLAGIGKKSPGVMTGKQGEWTWFSVKSNYTNLFYEDQMALSIYKFKKSSELVYSIGVVTAKKEPFVNYKVTMSMKMSYDNYTVNVASFTHTSNWATNETIFKLDPTPSATAIIKIEELKILNLDIIE